MVAVRLIGVQKVFSEHTPKVGPINLDIADGEFIIIVGSSGSGKTTLLRMLAGLESVTEGQITFDGNDITNLSPEKRDIAMVFQSYALYPHLSVEDNIGFPLKIAKVKKHQRKQRIRQIAEIVELIPYLDRKPAELSGGQRQRVAMARALIREPQLFLLDEPLSNLDAQLRAQTRVEISNMQKQLGVTCIYVTHDHIEAMTLADRIVVMRHGIIQQVGNPLEIYNKPANVFVASFFGTPSMSFIEGYICDQDVFFMHSTDSIATVNCTDRKILCGIRSEDWILDPSSSISAEIIRIEQLGSDCYLYVRGNIQDRDNGYFCVRGSGLLSYSSGDTIAIRPQNVHIFDAKTDVRISDRG